MKICHRVALWAILFAIVVATPGFAQPREATIALGREPEPPFCVLNPGGTVDITWSIEHQTTPNFVRYFLQDPTRTINIEYQQYPGSTGLNIARSWTVPNGLSDGKYWVRVEYWSFESGNEANAEVTFYVCAETGNLCVTKLSDTNCNGQLDGDDQPVPGYWICVTTPNGDDYCLQTGPDGRACWNNIPLGTYTVYEPVLPGWEPIGPSQYVVTLTSSEVVEVTFLNRNLELCYHACCLPDGTCQVLLQVDCEAQGGTWQVEPSCDGVVCPQPPGACCFPDGRCEFVTEADCAGLGGQWLGMFVPCDPNPCTQPPGACCFPDGTCQFVPRTICDQLGGIWLGYMVPCDPNPCPQPPGACCLPDGTCVYVLQVECTAGQWLGPFVPCDPNPCPQPPGACCFPDGSCQFLDQLACAQAGGQWLGFGSDCDPNPCPPPPGACCFEDGTCIFVTEADCVAQQGSWLGYGTDCDPNPCPITPVDRTTWGQIKNQYR